MQIHNTKSIVSLCAMINYLSTGVIFVETNYRQLKLCTVSLYMVHGMYHILFMVHMVFFLVHILEMHRKQYVLPLINLYHLLLWFVAFGQRGTSECAEYHDVSFNSFMSFTRLWKIQKYCQLVM